MIIISDSTVLINFALLDLFDRLKIQFGRIVVPRAVYNEVYGDGNHKPGSREVHEAKRDGWIEVYDITNYVFYNKKGIRELHKGEREAITLAFEKGNGFLLTDDGKAIEACIRFLKTRNIDFLTSIDICDLLYEKGIVRMPGLEMKIRLNQLNAPKFKTS